MWRSRSCRSCAPGGPADGGLRGQAHNLNLNQMAEENDNLFTALNQPLGVRCNTVVSQKIYCATYIIII